MRDKSYISRIIDQSSAPYFVGRFTSSLRELEMLQIAAQADRERQFAIVEQFKDEKGKRFRKAQMAALKGDEDVKLIQEIERRKKLLYKEFEKVWAMFTGTETGAKIVVGYLKSKGNIHSLKSTYRPEDVEMAVADWLGYVRSMCELNLQRYRENRNNRKELAKIHWWLASEDLEEFDDGEVHEDPLLQEEHDKEGEPQ